MRIDRWAGVWKVLSLVGGGEKLFLHWESWEVWSRMRCATLLLTKITLRRKGGREGV